MPEEMLLDVVLSGEKAILPDGALAAKDTPRTDLSISDEMVPSTKPWMALPSGCIACSLKHRRNYFATRKTPLNTRRILQRSTKGVRNFRTPLATGPYRSASTAPYLKRCFSTSRQGNARHPMGYFAILSTVRPLSIAVLRHLL